MKRHIFIVFGLVFAVFAQTAVSEPFVAVVSSDGVAVRSGPGIEFYPVLQLHTGDQVEVHYQQGEWCAIRPPIGSFSWVSAQHVDFSTGKVGTVLADGLASRIGSDHSDDCDAIQVSLKQGEHVLILGRRETPENLGSPAWLKIAPPSGEFRWVHNSALEVALSHPQRLSGPIQQVQHRTPSARGIPFPATPPATQSAEPAPPRLASASRPGEQSGGRTERYTNPFQHAFNELQREAYLAMTSPAEDDLFALLIERATELHQLAATDNELEKTYHLLESLKRTRLIRQELTLRRPGAVGAGVTGIGAMGTGTMGTGTMGRNVVARNTAASAGLAESDAHRNVTLALLSDRVVNDSGGVKPTQSGVNVGGYDIVGRLGEFDPAPPGHPPYAVVNEREQIICLISPSPGLDLSAHVGQFVGINGILGFYEKQQGRPLARHITAKSVQTLK